MGKHEINWENTVKAFDARFWYMSVGLNSERAREMCNETEDLHNELNYLHGRMFLKRGAVFCILFYLLLCTFPEESENMDWSDKHDEKFRLQMYSELDEGGLEGDE